MNKVTIPSLRFTYLLSRLLIMVAMMCSTGCVTYYHKYFSPNEPGRNTFFEIGGISCSIRIDAFPKNESTYIDSTFDLTIYAHHTCTQVWRERFDSLYLTRLVIRANGLTIEPEEPDIRMLRPCDIHWVFRPIVIPESQDSILVDFSLEYSRNDVMTTLDTTMIFYRIQGKKVDFWMD